MDVSKLLNETSAALETVKGKSSARDEAAARLQQATDELEAAQDVLEGYRRQVNEILSAAMPQTDSKVRIG